MNNIEHDQNGPFVRAHAATTEGQTETVYAVEVSHEGTTEWWDVSAKPLTNKRYADIRQMAYRNRRGADIRLVSRKVTISATEWVDADTRDGAE